MAYTFFFSFSGVDNSSGDEAVSQFGFNARPELSVLVCYQYAIVGLKRNRPTYWYELGNFVAL